MKIVAKLCYISLLIAATIQYKFRINFERANMAYLNKSYYHLFTLDAYLVNRTGGRAVRAMFKFVNDIEDTTKVHMAAAKFLSNEYKQGAIEFTGSVKTFLKQNVVASAMSKYCKPPPVWPLRGKVLYRCDLYLPSSTDFNIYFPPGKWRLTVNETNKNDKMFDLVVFGAVEEIVDY